MFAIIWISPLHYICYTQYRLSINPGVRVYILFTSPIHIHILKDFLKRWEMKTSVYKLNLFFYSNLFGMSYTDVFMTCAFIANSVLTHTYVSWLFFFLFFFHFHIDCYVRCLIANIASVSYTSRYFPSYNSLQSTSCIQLWMIFIQVRLLFYALTFLLPTISLYS